MIDFSNQMLDIYNMINAKLIINLSGVGINANSN